jgi:glycosyltransferase involved in cell wall biosynthesis
VNIGLYLQHGTGSGVGGAELMMATLGAAWAADHAVDLIHHRPELTMQRLAHFSGREYPGVRARVAPRIPEPAAARDPLRRYHDAAEWQSALSAGYDLFINCTHWAPPFCHAGRGVLLVLFPHYQRWTDVARVPFWKRGVHRLYGAIEWQRRLSSYERVVSISQFTRTWTNRRWGVDSSVVYPPVETTFDGRDKQRLILSVGRFNVRAYKKQRELMGAFRSLAQNSLAGWRYVSAGGLNDNAANRSYADQVQELAGDCEAVIDVNVSQTRLADLLASARIFWHAAGFGEDLDAEPGRAEHFGISTVEAMAAGCVPVVINAGAQPEIVEHGRSGFLWNSLEELGHYTRLLTEDAALWRQMSDAARQRAKIFSTPRFVREMSAVCQVGRDGLAGGREPAIVSHPVRAPQHAGAGSQSSSHRP